MPEGRLGQERFDHHLSRAEAATTNTDPGDAEREGGRSSNDIQPMVAALANDPSQGGAAEEQLNHDTHAGVVSPVKVRKPRGKRGAVGQVPVINQSADADSAIQVPALPDGGVDHFRTESQSSGVDPAIIFEIREQWRRRQAWHRAEKSLTLQAKALCRRLATDGDKAEADVIYRAAQGDGSHPMADIALVATFPLTEARDGVERHRKAVESRLRKLAKKLPVAPWVESVPGASLNTLAAVVGEAGDIGAFPYTNPAKLWKRMGLAVMPDGTRQRRVGGDQAVEHGYSPARRSVVWNIGGSLIGALGRGPRLKPSEDPDSVEGLSPLQCVFVKRLRYEAVRDSSHVRPLSKKGKESFSKHAAARAKRFVEKRFLLLLWLEWRKANGESVYRDAVPSSSLLKLWQGWQAVTISQ